jgi:hypothetical protein
MTRLSAIGYATLIAAILFAVLSLNDGSSEPSATMAPDLRVLRP